MNGAQAGKAVRKEDSASVDAESKPQQQQNMILAVKVKLWSVRQSVNERSLVG